MCHFLQSNGLDERFNQTIQSMLVKFVNERKSNWDEHLDSCSFAYNTARHDSTKFSPFELMFGRKALLPIQLETNGDDPNKVLHEFQNAPALDENSALLEKLIEGRSALIEEAKANIETAQEKQCEHYNQKHANPEAFLVGSKVLVKDFTRRKRQGGKMDFRWLGPYTIEKNLGKGAYLLRCDAGESSKRVNGAHMKPYFNPPATNHQMTPTQRLMTDHLTHHQLTTTPTHLMMNSMCLTMIHFITTCDCVDYIIIVFLVL